jgi:hypothetical protein
MARTSTKKALQDRLLLGSESEQKKRKAKTTQKMKPTGKENKGKGSKDNPGNKKKAVTIQ